MRTHRKCRPGFTLVELCVAAATTALIMMLLLPGIQAARTSAQMADCRNNLKRIGLAMHNYHDVFNVFPPGWVTGYQDGDSHSGFGWQVFILPYVDQAPLYRKLRFTEVVPVAGESDGLLELPLAAYQCPAADSQKINEWRSGYGRSCYSGNYGSVRTLRWVDGRAETYWPGAVPAATQQRYSSSRYRNRGTSNRAPLPNAPYGTSNGIFSWNSSVRIRDVSDGTSNTIMVGERGTEGASAVWMGVGSNKFESDAVSDASHYSPINQSLTGFSSAHSGGAYFVLVDGSVSFVVEGIDSTSNGKGVYQGIAGKSDGEVTPPDAFSKGPKLF